MSLVMRARSLLHWGPALCLALCASAGAALVPNAANAQAYDSGNVRMLRTGWNADQFGLVLDKPVQNPAGCPTPDGYVTEATQPGYDSFYEVALGAYKIGSPLTVVIDSRAGQCVAGRPRIIGINAAPIPPQPKTVTVVLRANASYWYWHERRFSDVPVIGTFTGHGTDCSHGGTIGGPGGPVSGPGVIGVAGWGQVEGNGHPDANSDSCVSWVAAFGFDFDLSPFTSVPGAKTIDRAVIRYNEAAEPACQSLVYTQGGFLVDSDIPCWSSGSGAPEDKPDGCVVLRIPSVDLGTLAPGQSWPFNSRTFSKVDRRGSWDVTDLLRSRVNPGLIPPPEAGGPEGSWGYALIGTFMSTSDLDAEDNTRCSSLITDIRMELTFTVRPDQGGTFIPPR
jgi:hypothetical protein